MKHFYLSRVYQTGWGGRKGRSKGERGGRNRNLRGKRGKSFNPKKNWTIFAFPPNFQSWYRATMAAQIFNRLGQLGVVSHWCFVLTHSLINWLPDVCLFVNDLKSSRVLQLEELWSILPSSMWTEVTGQSSLTGNRCMSSPFVLTIKWHVIRFVGVKKEVVGEGTHFMIPWVQKPIIYDIRARCDD